ncbi:MAG: hypothetical protein OEX81_04155 [Candidatus Pacebacteria bacterium]|nr:hypothetical protein [Candidatus Paceibacterota bacterium]
MLKREAVEKLTAAVFGMHKVRSLDLGDERMGSVERVLKILCNIAEGEQFSRALLDMVAKGPEEEISPKDYSVIVIGIARAIEILGEDIEDEMVQHLASICQTMIIQGEAANTTTEVCVGSSAQEVAQKTFLKNKDNLVPAP